MEIKPILHTLNPKGKKTMCKQREIEVEYFSKLGLVLPDKCSVEIVNGKSFPNGCNLPRFEFKPNTLLPTQKTQLEICVELNKDRIEFLKSLKS